jgi:hypothetical protein
VAPEELRKTHRKTGASFVQSHGTQPNTISERNVDQTLRRPFGAAAGQVVVALNRKFIDIAKRNINTGFDLAAGLARAKNVTEVMQLQLDYWRTLFGPTTHPTDENSETEKTRG